MFSKLEESGIPIVDKLMAGELEVQTNRVDYYSKLFAEITPGLTHFLFHPAKISPELNAIVPETASARNQDYEAFTNQQLKECAEENDLKIIGYREIRDNIYK